MKRYVEVELGGSTRRMRFDFNSIIDLEEYFGKGISAIMTDEQIGFRVMRAMYWAGLKSYHRRLNIEQVGKWIQSEIDNGKGIEELFTPIEKALKASGILGDIEDAEEGEEKN